MTDREGLRTSAEGAEVSQVQEIHVSYGPMEQFYDQDKATTRLVKKRYETWVENGQKMGRWDYVPASRSEQDANV